jgi:membrane protease YdiL (CAAX protease family)
MQARLREHWSPVVAVLATSTAFGALHLDPAALSVVHMAQALAMGIYLGFVAEISGSTLPAVVCHVVNNIVYTLQTALGVAVVGREANLAAVAIGAVLLGACIWWIRRAAPAPAPV